MKRAKPSPRAVALKYDSKSPPRVVAHGSGEQAELMRTAALRAGVPLMEEPALAEALLALELDSTIPEELYVAVAVVLSWAYWMQGKRPEGYVEP